MPHKRAKRTVRDEIKEKRGTDLAPGKDSIGNEAIPKSAARVLNAFKIREDWKSKKRKPDEGVDEKPARKRKKTEDDKRGERGKGKASQLRIKPGESMQHFNRRVEDDMRPLVKSAMRTSYAVARDTRKAEIEARTEAKKKKNEQVENIPAEWKSRQPSPLPIDKHASRPKEFEKVATSAPRRLNDVAQAPPELNKLSRGPKNLLSSKDDILSMAQKSMMEQEREKAIARYRQLKASRRQAGVEGIGRAQDDQDDQ